MHCPCNSNTENLAIVNIFHLTGQWPWEFHIAYQDISFPENEKEQQWNLITSKPTSSFKIYGSVYGRNSHKQTSFII